MTSLTKAKRVVIKIGSILLVDPESGRVHDRWLRSLAEDVAQLRTRGQDVILVSSGAIALGRRHLGLRAGRLKLEESCRGDRPNPSGEGLSRCAVGP
jgi:glutamate 5-kinase